eukprot:GHVT01063536.1.p2 GENE.GHVT01063536.1~~GHVT01063536.1.p2  ORF type:complete len:109 (+),score=14.72 GHVT01063536.1:595-921(+)
MTQCCRAFKMLQVVYPSTSSCHDGDDKDDADAKDDKDEYIEKEEDALFDEDAGANIASISAIVPKVFFRYVLARPWVRCVLPPSVLAFAFGLFAFPQCRRASFPRREA